MTQRGVAPRTGLLGRQTWQTGLPRVGTIRLPTTLHMPHGRRSTSVALQRASGGCTAPARLAGQMPDAGHSRALELIQRVAPTLDQKLSRTVRCWLACADLALIAW